MHISDPEGILTALLAKVQHISDPEGILTALLAKVHKSAQKCRFYVVTNQNTQSPFSTS